jgi:predicted PurR-regulated permease PerM
MGDGNGDLAERRAPSDGRRMILAARDPAPLKHSAKLRRTISQQAIIVICILSLGAFLYVARSLLLPVIFALVVGLTLGPYTGYAIKRGVPAWILAAAVVLTIVGLSNLAVVMLANPVAELLRQAPEIADAVTDRLYVFHGQFSALHRLQTALGAKDGDNGLGFNVTRLIEGAVTIVTPAAVQFAVQFVLFIGTLFFFILGRARFRANTIAWFGSRAARLRALKIIGDVEAKLSGFLIVVTGINLCLGVATAGIMHLLGMPYPLLWGAFAFALNFVPYIGAGLLTVMLFFVALLTYPTLAGALLPPAAFLLLNTLEGQFLTPAIVGRRVLHVHPLVIFLSVAFWAWLWGPLGAFLATPFLIVARAAYDHLYPNRNAELPG